jgi:hypothetical protein
MEDINASIMITCSRMKRTEWRSLLRIQTSCSKTSYSCAKRKFVQERTLRLSPLVCHILWWKYGRLRASWGGILGTRPAYMLTTNLVASTPKATRMQRGHLYMTVTRVWMSLNNSDVIRRCLRNQYCLMLARGYLHSERGKMHQV